MTTFDRNIWARREDYTHIDRGLEDGENEFGYSKQEVDDFERLPPTVHRAEWKKFGLELAFDLFMRTTGQHRSVDKNEIDFHDRILLLARKKRLEYQTRIAAGMAEYRNSSDRHSELRLGNKHENGFQEVQFRDNNGVLRTGRQTGNIPNFASKVLENRSFASMMGETEDWVKFTPMHRQTVLALQAYVDDDAPLFAKYFMEKPRVVWTDIERLNDGPFFDKRLILHIFRAFDKMLSVGGVSGEPYAILFEYGAKVVAHYVSHLFYQPRKSRNPIYKVLGLCTYRVKHPHTGPIEWQKEGAEPTARAAVDCMMGLVLPPHDNIEEEIRSAAAVTAMVLKGIEVAFSDIDEHNERYVDNYKLAMTTFVESVHTAIAAGSVVVPVLAVADKTLAATVFAALPSIFVGLKKKKFKTGTLGKELKEMKGRFVKSVEDGKLVPGLPYQPHLSPPIPGKHLTNDQHIRIQIGKAFLKELESNLKSFGDTDADAGA